MRLQDRDLVVMNDLQFINCRRYLLSFSLYRSYGALYLFHLFVVAAVVVVRS